MSYYFSKKLTGSFEEVKEKVVTALKERGFGVLTEISIDETFKKKLDVDYKKYHILGACNPNYAYKALASEDHIGLMLPCNVIITESASNEYEVAAVDPAASMAAVKNIDLMEVAVDVRDLLKEAINEL